MTNILTFWVLIVVSTNGDHAMVAQQFVSERACIAAKAFVEDKRGTYVYATCIKDTADGRRSPDAPKDGGVRP